MKKNRFGKSDRFVGWITLSLVFCCGYPGLASGQDVFIDPGETQQIGAATGATQSVSDCGGLNSCGVEYDISTNTMGAVTALSGVGSMKTASVTLTNQITVSGDSDRAIDGTISGSVSWSGDLESLGVVGAAAFVNVGMSLVDLTTGLVVAGTGVMSNECETFILLDSCLKRVVGSSAVNFAVSLQRGRSYELRFNLTCKSNSGAGDANCVFNQNGAFPLAGGSVSRSDFTLSLEPDLIGMIEQLQAAIDMLKEQIDTHDKDVRSLLEQNNQTTLEVIRLLHTPQGRRDTDQPACNGNRCDFPDMD